MAYDIWNKEDFQEVQQIDDGCYIGQLRPEFSRLTQRELYFEIAGGGFDTVVTYHGFLTPLSEDKLAKIIDHEEKHIAAEKKLTGGYCRMS